MVAAFTDVAVAASVTVVREQVAVVALAHDADLPIGHIGWLNPRAQSEGTAYVEIGRRAEVD